MRIANVVKIVSFGIVTAVSVVSCYDSLYDENNGDKKTLSVTEAKDVFRQKVRDYEKLKTQRQVNTKKTFFPDDYTPQWNKAVRSENEYIWSMDIPILTNKRLMVTHREKTDTIYIPASQKLVIIKNKESGKKYMYILTLMPDKECGSKFKNNIEKTYTHAGNVSNFTGIAVYSTWDGKVIEIKRQGKKNVIQLNFKNTKINRDEKTKKFERITSDMGGLVLMGGDDWYLGEIEGAEVTWCQECWNRIDMCTCWNIDYCSTCGYSICRCDEYQDDPNDPNNQACPNCGRINCDGSCESGNNGEGGGGGGEDGGNTEPPPQEPPHAYDDWDMDEKTKQELTDAFDSLYNDCVGKILMESVPDNFKVRYNPSVNLMSYNGSLSTLSWAMYTGDGIYMYAVVEEFFHIYQRQQGRSVIQNGKIMNLINLETEAKIAAYKYTLVHGLDESTNWHRTSWENKEKKLMDNYLKNPTADNYNAVLNFVKNIDEYANYQDRIMDSYKNTALMDNLFNDCDKYKK
jgi:hypothetical protein